jgi:hypothetical protein
MSKPQHRADPATRKATQAQGVSWSIVAYLVIAVLAKHYFGIDVTPW